MVREHWERACYIHIIAIPPNNSFLNTFFDTEDYNSFISKRFDIFYDSSDKKQVEAFQVLKAIYDVSTIGDRQTLKYWREYLSDDSIDNCSDDFYTIITKYKPADYHKIPVRLFYETSDSEQDTLFGLYEIDRKTAELTAS